LSKRVDLNALPVWRRPPVDAAETLLDLGQCGGVLQTGSLAWQQNGNIRLQIHVT